MAVSKAYGAYRSVYHIPGIAVGPVTTGSINPFTYSEPLPPTTGPLGVIAVPQTSTTPVGAAGGVAEDSHSTVTAAGDAGTTGAVVWTTVQV